jgi:hypothetical protein
MEREVEDVFLIAAAKVEIAARHHQLVVLGQRLRHHLARGRDD